MDEFRARLQTTQEQAERLDRLALKAQHTLEQLLAGLEELAAMLARQARAGATAPPTTEAAPRPETPQKSSGAIAADQ